MRILKNPEELRKQCREWHMAGLSTALVPTMGYYHKGHESLMEYGRKNADRLIVSLFVNPAQFGPNEDLEAYPRDLERDAAIAEANGVDILFCPDVADMYEADHATWVEVPELAKGLCGMNRPTHFRGVCTVVLKLLIITGADIAIFGEKDWQQQAILKRMARDLDVPTRIVSRPAIREADGLALSSRNVYLNGEERKQAPNIRKGLMLAKKLLEEGCQDGKTLVQEVKTFWKESMPLAELDYLSLVHPESLAALERVEESAILACALRLGKARLIDNIMLIKKEV